MRFIESETKRYTRWSRDGRVRRRRLWYCRSKDGYLVEVHANDQVKFDTEEVVMGLPPDAGRGMDRPELCTGQALHLQAGGSTGHKRGDGPTR